MGDSFTNSDVRFRIRLKQLHDATGKTAYRVSKDTGISPATVRKYVEADEIVSETLPAPVITIINYLGGNWRDAKLIEIIPIEDDSPPKRKTPLRSDLVPVA